MKKVTGLLGAVVLFFSCAAHSNTITYTSENVGGNTFEFNFTVENTGGDSIEAFALLFDLGLYENLSVVSSPGDWDPLVFPPDPALPDGAILDLFALVLGLAPGETLTGITIRIDYLGDGSPGDLLFEIYDPGTYETLVSGVATNETVSVPEPGTFSILLLGLLILAFNRRRATKPPERPVAVQSYSTTARAA